MIYIYIFMIYIYWDVRKGNKYELDDLQAFKWLLFNVISPLC
jgi:hypothetical protein